jgi:nucleoside-diphosphate-sugar epimerase
MRIAVTGATGFIGSSLCMRLAAQGDVVIGLTRRAVDLPPGVNDLAVLDETATPDRWRKVLAGCEAVVHLAARTHRGEKSDPRTRAEFHQTNVLYTQTLVESALAAGVERFVFVSSTKVMGERSVRGVGGEWQIFSGESPAHPEGPYGESKYAAETLLRDAIACAGKQLTILRPPLIYGPGVGGNLFTLLRVIQRGIPLPLAAIDNRRSLLHREHLIDAIVLTLKTSGSSIQVYTLADCAMSTPELIDAMARGLGCHARLWRCPSTILRALGRGFGFDAQLARLTESLVVDSSTFERETGWRPRLDLVGAWAEIGQWFRQVS